MSRLRSPDSTPDDIPLTDRQYDGAWDAGYEAAHEYHLDNKHRRGQSFLDDPVEALLHVHHLRDPRVPRVVEGDPSFYEWIYAVGAGAKAFNESTRGDTMSRTSTASDRSVLIRLASTLPAGSAERRAILSGLSKTALTKGTVRAFIEVASSKLTQYDQRLEAKQPNMYRLGHYLKALTNVREDVQDVMDDASPEALGRLRASFARRFNNLPPIVATIKQIDQYLATGKLPRLVGV
jgi:hypothetical protein